MGRPYEITLLRSDEYGRSMGVLVYFGHMDARSRKCILRVPQGSYGSVRTYRLGNTHMIICGVVRSPQAACMRPVRFRTRSIGSNRQIRSAVRVFYSPVTERWESLTFGHGLCPTCDCVHRSFTLFRDQ